jgi:RNA polymerase sigma factor (sigma-70 family)
MPDALQLPDRVLVDRLLDGDPEAADLFVTRFTRLVWAILAREFPSLSHEQKEDLYQTVFARLWDDDYRRLRAWTGEGNLAGYLAVTVRHLALDYVRRSNRERPELDAEPAADDPAPDELAWLEEQRALVRQLLEDCSEQDRRIYDLRVAGRSYEEIAAELDVTVNLVGVRLNRLVKKLRDRLDTTRPLATTATTSKTRKK